MVMCSHKRQREYRTDSFHKKQLTIWKIEKSTKSKGVYLQVRERPIIVSITHCILYPYLLPEACSG